ncbi:OLC1v1031673C1 [Oldenlandia corymbosa var. corymbosa]|uniref:OLC1v1031673C1 n=1 Tax=Oldenlandia corymbosa var. corymbosa TaxID=529605 RepID=A0AAV1CJR7_OLDCO|nr:OLC1v1031673C1 [Oldenlandia corymbosa var. corymbosa]
MAGNLRRRNQQRRRNSSSSSSDSDEDPDYTARLPSQRLRRQSGSRDSAEFQGSSASGSTSRVRRRHETLDSIQEEAEPGSLQVERINLGGTRRSVSRRSRNFNVEEGYSENDQFGNGNKKYSARREKNQSGEAGEDQKKATILSWLMDSKAIEEDEHVFCMDEYDQKIIKEGIIKRDGILCNCCQKLFDAECFVRHGGRRSDKPYDLIVTARDQISLLSCMMKAWNMPKNLRHRKFNGVETKDSCSDEYDDACVVCADGGNLTCCDKCNSTYHHKCVGLEVVPRGSWYCPYCVCKFCGDPPRENAGLCECPQCEKRYHWDCHQRMDLKMIDLNSNPCAPFCERRCKEVHDKLEESLVGMKNELDEGFSWSLLHRMDDDTGIYFEDTYKRTMCHSKLAVALGLLEDCFKPIDDRHTKINVIPSIVYNCGSNFTRMQFKGFYTAILEKNEEIICVATLRIHGTSLAEMPFIATSDIHRRKGMCRKLLIAMESALCYLNVENLIIPSTPQMMSNWTEKYGFHLPDEAMKKEIMIHNTLMFYDTIRLQKNLVPPHLAKSGRSSAMPHGQTMGNQQQHNWPRFRHKVTMTSIFDIDFQPPSGWNSMDRRPHQ